MLSPILIVAICLLAVMAIASVRRIPEGQVVSLRRIGGHVRILQAGTHLVVPLIERVAHRIKLAGNRVTLNAATPAGVCRGTIFYQVIDPQRAEAFIDDAEIWLQSRSAEWLADSAAPQDTIGDQRQRLKCSLNDAAGSLGLLVTRVELTIGD